MKLLAALCFSVPLLFLAGALADEKKKEPTCPISGKAISADSFIEINGKKINFCCDGCQAPYKKKIGLVDEGPKACPLSGQPAKKETGLIHQTAELVAFCCNNCPKAYAKKHGFEAKETEPGKCPMSGAPAKAEHSLTVNGEKVYFCCNNCPKAYKKKLAVKEPKEGEPLAPCPMSGNAAKAETAQIHVKTKMVYFCCNNCRGKYAEKHFKAEEGKEKAEKGEKKEAEKKVKET
jgi:hypothetical protein